MSKNLDEIMSAELKVQSNIENAYLKREEMIDAAIKEGLLEVNLIEEKTEKAIDDLLIGKKEKLAEINSKLFNVVKNESDKITERVSSKVKKVIDEIYREAIKND